MEDALLWYNNLEESTRNNIILSIYNLVGDTADNVVINKLKRECLGKIEEKERESDEKDNKIAIIKDCFNNNMLDEIRNLDKKITNNVIGRMGELLTIDLLELNFPKAIIRDNNSMTKTKEKGDIYFELNNIKCMIESKAQTEANLKRDPSGTIKKFENEFINYVQNGDIDFGIFVAQRSNIIPNKGTISLEFIPTSKGNKLVCYIANTFIHQDRLISAIESGLSIVNNIYDNGNKNRNNINTMMASINCLLNDISSYSYNLKEKHKVAKMTMDLYQKDKLFYTSLNDKLKDIIKSGNNKELDNRILDIANKLYSGNRRFLKRDLIRKCGEEGITKDIVNKMGNIMLIKSKLASRRK